MGKRSVAQAAFAAPVKTTTSAPGKSNLNGRPFVKGFDPRRHRPPKGNPFPGKAAEDFKLKMIRYIFKPQTMKRLRKLLRNADDREFIAAFKLITERAFGKPTQQVDMKIERTIEDLLEESYGEESDEADR